MFFYINDTVVIKIILISIILLFNFADIFVILIIINITIFIAIIGQF